MMIMPNNGVEDGMKNKDRMTIIMMMMVMEIMIEPMC